MTIPFPYLETDNLRVLAFRFREDVNTNRHMAAELRARADALEATFADVDPKTLDFPNMDAIERAAKHVNSSTIGYDDWQRAQLVRRIVVTGESLYHAVWVLFGSRGGAGCDCGPCADARNAKVVMR